jgi:ATP-dependent Lhr-like helicase
MPLKSFHPATRAWFENALGQPTEVQAKAWPAIKDGRHTLIAAPTGSGKTLAAFYAAIDELVQQSLNGQLPDRTQIVYVSPLKALSNDIHRNLEIPLNGIKEELHAQGYPSVHLSAAVRTGDTTPQERQKMLKDPPHILVTTPESLYLLLTSQGGRAMLGGVKTVIVDEIHALLGNKRGAHLALSIERLEALTARPLQRIGLSATQKPVEMVADFLVGNRDKNTTDCVVIDSGHRRAMDLRIEVPKAPLTAVMSNEVWGELHERLIELVQEHRTTLIFVNTRRLAERLAMALSERIGEAHVSSHHGSMSKEHRHSAEQRLKAGELKVLVATASMELGIDIGSVDLVVQFSSPKSIAAFLQRVGRSGHQVKGIPKGILFPLSLDDLMECVALLDSVRRGELDRIIIPEMPLDILSQQIVAEVAGQEWGTEELYTLFKKAYPYRALSMEKFMEIIYMVSDGFTTRRGRRGAYLHYDAVNGRLRARRGARLAALTNGGAIADMFDYEVVLQPEGIVVGSLNEDFALESLSGDIFTLGTHAWQLIRIEGLKVIVQDAAGKPPSVPFWLGEGAGRSKELSESVSRLRQTVSELLDKDPLPQQPVEHLSQDFSIGHNSAVRWLVDEVKVSEPVAEQLVIFLWMGKVGLGVMPTRERIVAERFFDEAGDMHLVIHSLYGSRVNRGWGLALRKKFCRNFNFELQAAATENNIILSLSSSHSFPVDDVFKYLNTKILRDTLIQAMLDAPLFEIRWRTNATRALAILRNRAGKRVPPHLQRMQAEDLIAQVFPDQIACAENIQGEREIPEHPLVEQVVHDCLHEAMDIDELETLIGHIESSEIEVIAKDLREPSIFAQEVINARPYAFLDDTEFAERRVNAIRNRSWLDPSEAKDLSKLELEAIERVKEEAWPQAQDVDELHDALSIHGFITQEEGIKSNWSALFADLIAQGRATRLELESGRLLWVAAERMYYFKAVYQNAIFKPELHLPDHVRQESMEKHEALREILRGRLEAQGPLTVDQLIADLGLSKDDLEYSLVNLEHEGFVFRGRFTPDTATEEWCERRLLQRIHKYSIESLRQSIQPVSVQAFMRFLFVHHRMHRDDQGSGPAALQSVLDSLEGYQAPASAWEADLLPARMADYDPSWLDMLCMSGKIIWGRFNWPKNQGAKSSPVKSTPISLVSRSNEYLWRAAAQTNGHVQELSPTAQKVQEYLKTNGASFFDDIVARTHLLKTEVEEAIAQLVVQGLVISDSYAGMRGLLTPEKYRKESLGIAHAGRWSLLARPVVDGQPELEYTILEQIVFAYLKRWGVVFRSLMEKESFSPPWRILVRVLRRLELRGQVRGGRFVSQVSGEQFALPETVEQLRRLSRKQVDGELIPITAVDPLNLLGIILPGRRVANLAGNRILFRDGLPVAILEKGEVEFLTKLDPKEEWEAQKILVRRISSPKLGYYLSRRQPMPNRISNNVKTL